MEGRKRTGPGGLAGGRLPLRVVGRIPGLPFCTLARSTCHDFFPPFPLARKRRRPAASPGVGVAGLPRRRVASRRTAGPAAGRPAGLRRCCRPGCRFVRPRWRAATGGPADGRSAAACAARVACREPLGARRALACRRRVASRHRTAAGRLAADRRPAARPPLTLPPKHSSPYSPSAVTSSSFYGCETQAGHRWTGTYVTGATACAVVRYHGPTNRRGSRWLATIRRDAGTVWRASVPFGDGPLAAARAAADRGGVSWSLTTCHTLDPDAYVVGFGAG